MLTLSLCHLGSKHQEIPHLRKLKASVRITADIGLCYDQYLTLVLQELLPRQKVQI